MFSRRSVVAALTVATVALSGGCRDSALEPFADLLAFRGCARVRGIALPGDTGGELTIDDCFVRRTYFDYYELTIPARRNMTFTMNAVGFDPVIAIYDRAADRLVAVIDDAPGTTNAQGTIMLSAGVYVIGLTSFDTYGMGTYHLDIRAPT